MIPREGTTDEIRVGSYVRADSDTWKVVEVQIDRWTGQNRNGEMIGVRKPWKAEPITFMEPTPEEALATVQRILGAEVVAERDKPRTPFRVSRLGNVIRDWHHHMHLFHGIHTATGPGSRSIERVKEHHRIDHEDAAEGRPLGAYVQHVHP